MYAPAYHVASDFYDRSRQAFPSILEPTLYALGTPSSGAVLRSPASSSLGTSGGTLSCGPHFSCPGLTQQPVSGSVGTVFALPCRGEGQPFCRSPTWAPRALRFQPTVQALTPRCLHTDHQVLRT